MSGPTPSDDKGKQGQEKSGLMPSHILILERLIQDFGLNDRKLQYASHFWKYLDDRTPEKAIELNKFLQGKSQSEQEEKTSYPHSQLCILENFDKFYEDMGLIPSNKHSLDRINNSLKKR